MTNKLYNYSIKELGGEILMERNDVRWMVAYGVLGVTVVGFILSGRFALFNHHFPYVAGFLQFTIFATSGEILSTRMLYSKWELSKATAFKALCWGIGGLFVTLAFRIFSEGITVVMEVGILPLYGNRLALAFFTSCANNCFFAPIHASAMRICGNYADMKYTLHQRITVRESVDSIDWGELVDFTMFKTIPFFWIPINTIVFLLPVDYRIVCASILSLVFGVLMTILKIRERKAKYMKRMEVKND
jgi:hypothetical protein